MQKVGFEFERVGFAWDKAKASAVLQGPRFTAFPYRNQISKSDLLPFACPVPRVAGLRGTTRTRFRCNHMLHFACIILLHSLHGPPFLFQSGERETLPSCSIFARLGNLTLCCPAKAIHFPTHETVKNTRCIFRLFLFSHKPFSPSSSHQSARVRICINNNRRNCLLLTLYLCSYLSHLDTISWTGF